MLLREFQLYNSCISANDNFAKASSRRYCIYPFHKSLYIRKMQLKVTGQSHLRRCWLPPVLSGTYEKPSRPRCSRIVKQQQPHSASLPSNGSIGCNLSSARQLRMSNIKTQGTAASEELCKGSVKFSVPVQVNFGDIVKVVGNHPILGSWDCNSGLELQWNKGHVWEREVELAPGELQFKCVVVKNGGMTMWEPGPNRSVQISESVAFKVFCKWWDTKHTSISKASNIVKSTIDNMLLNNVPLPISPSQHILQKSMLPLEPTDTVKKLEDVLEMLEPLREAAAEAKKKTEKPLLAAMDGNANIRIISDISPDIPSAPQKVQKTGKFKLIASGHSIPHIDKIEKGGEDAFFISESFNGSMGLADGVGSWGKEGIDPAMYPKTLMRSAKRAIERQKGKRLTAKDAIMHAQYRATAMGSSTCIIAILNDKNILDVANVGDSGLRIIRDGKIIFATEMQEHDFNFPYQLTHPDYAPGDKAADAEIYEFEVQEGDMIILGSDGIFDNIWDKDLEDVISFSLKTIEQSEKGAAAMAEAIARVAHQNAADRQFYSPWTAGAMQATCEADWLLNNTNCKNPYLGGKMDDCTAVVAFVTSSD